MLFTLGYFMDMDEYTTYSSSLHYIDAPKSINVNNVRIENAIVDTLYVDDDSLKDYTSPPETWTEGSTVMFGNYDVNADTSDIGFDVSKVQYLQILRREYKNLKSLSSEWTTIHTQYINKATDFIFTIYDRFVKSSTSYEYAIVTYEQNNKGDWKISEPLNVNFDGIYIVDADSIFGTNFEPEVSSYNRYNNSTAVNTLNDKYPYVVKNGTNNYDSGNASGKFAKLVDCEEFVQENITDYTGEILDFLTDGKPKVLKLYDGNAWIVSITNAPQVEYPDNVNFVPKISFDWTEIGNINSTSDLENYGLLTREV